MRIPIHLQREIARLHYYDPNSSDRAIAGTVGMSPSTIGSFRRMLRKQAHEWSAIAPLDDDQWRDTLGTHDRSIAQRKPLPDWQWVHTEMQRPDATMEQLWREWRETCPEGVAYTQFAVGYRAWRKNLHVVM